MSKPYDATGKELLETGPADWVAFLGPPVDPGTVSLIDADLSTVTAAADKVIRIAGDPLWLMNVELQASADRDLPRRLLAYAGLLQSKHECDVASAVFLLRPEANHSSLTGSLAITPPSGPAWEFRYRVIRVWECNPTELLSAGLGMMPLAPISAAQPVEIPDIIDRMRRRLDAEAPPPLAAKLWTATSVLMGLRFDDAITDMMLEGVRDMRESTTVQKWLRMGRADGKLEGKLEGKVEGKQEEIRNILIRLGEKKYGTPVPAVATKVAEEQDLEKLEALTLRISDVSSWDDLFAE